MLSQPILESKHFLPLAGHSNKDKGLIKERESVCERKHREEKLKTATKIGIKRPKR